MSLFLEEGFEEDFAIGYLTTALAAIVVQINDKNILSTKELILPKELTFTDHDLIRIKTDFKDLIKTADPDESNIYNQVKWAVLGGFPYWTEWFEKHKLVALKAQKEDVQQKIKEQVDSSELDKPIAILATAIKSLQLTHMDLTNDLLSVLQENLSQGDIVRLKEDFGHFISCEDWKREEVHSEVREAILENTYWSNWLNSHKDKDAHIDPKIIDELKTFNSALITVLSKGGPTPEERVDFLHKLVDGFGRDLNSKECTAIMDIFYNSQLRKSGDLDV